MFTERENEKERAREREREERARERNNIRRHSFASGKECSCFLLGPGIILVDLKMNELKPWFIKKVLFFVNTFPDPSKQ